MKKLGIIILALLFYLLGFAQQKAPVTLPDVNKLMKMSPAELEAYKKKRISQAGQQAADLSKQYNLDLNPALIPGREIKAPVMDTRRLSLIPIKPPTRTELVASVQQSMQQVSKGIPAPRMEQIRQFTAQDIKVESLQEAALGSFYNNNPKEGMYLMMLAVKEAPDSLEMVNNLAAMFNMHNIEQKAIPLLQYLLEKAPNNSIALNNIGQAYLGLGELFKAAEYLDKCLSLDSLNIEANHSRGMLHMFRKEYAQAMKYFEREMSVAMRASTIAMAYKTGQKFDIRSIAKRKHARSGRPEKDYFEEINLGKFKLPQFPSTTKEMLALKDQWMEFATSVQEESMYWRNIGLQLTSDGNEMPGLYSPLAKAMMEELTNEFTPDQLQPYSEEDAGITKEIMETAGKLLIAEKCIVPREIEGIEAQQAWLTKCCEERLRPLADQMLSKLGGHLMPIIRKGMGRWKAYINSAIAIAQLDPSAGNQGTVYLGVSGYFTFLSWACLFYTGGDVMNLLPHCKENYDPQAIDSTIESDRKWRVECPAWLNMEVDFKRFVVKADCNKYVIEAGESLMGAFEHEFKSGRSTILFGSGIKGEFLNGLIKGESKGQFFLTFDENKNFADFGYKNTFEVGTTQTPFRYKRIKIGGNPLGYEASTTISIINGYKSEVEKKGIAALF